ncbi:hypothetical protein EJB05_01278, partial [Eragrostis curvula]
MNIIVTELISLPNTASLRPIPLAVPPNPSPIPNNVLPSSGRQGPSPQPHDRAIPFLGLLPSLLGSSSSVSDSGLSGDSWFPMAVGAS